MTVGFLCFVCILIVCTEFAVCTRYGILSDKNAKEQNPWEKKEFLFYPKSKINTFLLDINVLGFQKA
jgi:hypothetical protein